MKLRIVSYNIRVGIESSIAQIAAALAPLEPDVLCLQEVGNHWLMGEKIDQTGQLADTLGHEHHHFLGALTAADGGQFGVAMSARWPLANIAEERLLQHIDERRVVLSAQIEAPEPFRLVTSHLSIRAEERLAQATRINAIARSLGPRTVLVGDFNDAPHAPSTTAARDGLRCAFDTAGAGPAVTFPTKAPAHRLDYVFVGAAFDVVGAWVATDIKTSDHLPLVADLRLRARA